MNGGAGSLMTKMLAVFIVGLIVSLLSKVKLSPTFTKYFRISLFVLMIGFSAIVLYFLIRYDSAR